METFTLNAEIRTDMGKGASRRLRRQGSIPGIVYGAESSATPISLAHNNLMHQLEHEAFFSHILSLNLDGKTEKVVLKALQRHPWRESLLHIDLLRIKESEKLIMNVPLHLLNEDKCAGVKVGGGIVNRIMTELAVSCLPKDLPEYIEVDILNMEIGDSVHLGDLKMPEGVENHLLLHGNEESRMQSVVSINMPRAPSDETTEEEEGESGIQPEAEAPSE
ncbi:MAG: 50S ribosomal protein L25/general stress protein Ctc [Candidatus Eutrophobiaceae bacterium]